MRIIKTALTAVFAIFILNAASQASELNALKAADVQALTADVQIPAARAPLNDAIQPDNPSSPGPVIITVPGLSFAQIGPEPFELNTLTKIFRFFFPNKRVEYSDLARQYEAAMRDYYMLEDGEALPAAGQAKRVPDNYIEESLKAIPNYDSLGLVVLPFRWSRDPDDTDKVIPELAARIGEVYDQYKGSGRPIFIISHSWGTMLSHSAMHRLERARPEVRISRWITMGSPLVPANPIVALFVKVGIKKEELEKKVSKPSIVRQWRNIWAMRDLFANEIKSADGNDQVDLPVADVEKQVIDLVLHGKELKKAARKDLLTLRNPDTWHESYFYDYKATLKSLQKEVYIPIFEPVLAPQVTAVKN